MESMFSTFSRRQTVPTNILNFTPLTVPQQKHLTRVYGTLFGGVGVTGFGTWFFLNVFPVPPLLSFIASIGLMAFLSTSSSVLNKNEEKKKLIQFGSLSFFMGAMLGPYIGYVSQLNPGILPTAFFGTLATFGCFSLAAMFAKKRSMLFLGSILGSVLFYMTMMNFANIFFRSRLVHDISLYVGLFTYMGFVLYDTQLTLEDFNRGSRNYINHALQFYTDFLGIFIRLLQILAQQEEKKRQKKNSRE